MKELLHKAKQVFFQEYLKNLPLLREFLVNDFKILNHHKLFELRIFATDQTIYKLLYNNLKEDGFNVKLTGHTFYIKAQSILDYYYLKQLQKGGK